MNFAEHEDWDFIDMFDDHGTKYALGLDMFENPRMCILAGVNFDTGRDGFEYDEIFRYGDQRECMRTWLEICGKL